MLVYRRSNHPSRIASHAKAEAEKERLYAQYGEAKKELKEYGVIKQNVDGILRRTPEQERTQEL